MDLSKLIEAWICGQAADEESPEYRENWWAIEAVIHLSETNPEDVWSLIQTALSDSKFESVRDILAAGPLEDLLSYHGPAYIERVEALAARNERFKSLLGRVWLDSEDTPVWRRVYAAASIEPPFPEGWRSKGAV